jgi:hypothetical protein
MAPKFPKPGPDFIVECDGGDDALLLDAYLEITDEMVCAVILYILRTLYSS